ncbi:MAG: hypothetical protein AAFR24_20985 [Cyanobacteria bacterium J06627_3]
MVRFPLIGVLIASLLGSCSAIGIREQDAPSNLTPAAVAESVSDPVPETKDTTQVVKADDVQLAPGRYCYQFDDGVFTNHLRLRVDQTSQLAGDARSSIQNDDAGYYTSYAQVFSGPLTGHQAAVNITTWIEYDVQDTRETWTFRNDELLTETALLNRADCQLVDLVFQDQEGLEARDLLDGANAVHTQRVEFLPGKSAAIVSNSVIRGERDVYLLGANGGQQMDVSVKALENNAVFDVISPSGYILSRETVSESFFLPHTGDYQVIVGGTRGNATYELTIGIQ